MIETTTYYIAKPKKAEMFVPGDFAVFATKEAAEEFIVGKDDWEIKEVQEPRVSGL